jgi:hypothetical protein
MCPRNRYRRRTSQEARRQVEAGTGRPQRGCERAINPSAPAEDTIDAVDVERIRVMLVFRHRLRLRVCLCRLVSLVASMTAIAEIGLPVDRTLTTRTWICVKM